VETSCRFNLEGARRIRSEGVISNLSIAIGHEIWIRKFFRACLPQDQRRGIDENLISLKSLQGNGARVREDGDEREGHLEFEDMQSLKTFQLDSNRPTDGVWWEDIFNLLELRDDTAGKRDHMATDSNLFYTAR
jgi:hypothetical protein